MTKAAIALLAGVALTILGVILLAVGVGNSGVEQTPEGSASGAVADVVPTPATAALSPGDATTARLDPTLQGLPSVPVVVESSGLGSGSREFSAVGLNEVTNRLFVADDADRIFEYELDAQGRPNSSPRRIIDVDIGGSDIEGLTWMFDSTYGLASEDSGTVFVVEIDDDTLRLRGEHVVATLRTGIAEVDGNGIEGVAYVHGTEAAFEFVVVSERPPTVHYLSVDDGLVASSPLRVGLADASDVWVGEASVHVLSDESRQIVSLERDAVTGSLTERARLDLDALGARFDQPEGLVVSRDGARLYVVGESTGDGGLTLGFFVRP